MCAMASRFVQTKGSLGLPIREIFNPFGLIELFN